MKSPREQIDLAFAAHNQWKTRLRSAADSRSSDVTAADAGREDRCEFGKWLKGDALALSATERGADADKVRQLHADFHRAAGAALSAALRGDRRTYDAAVAVDGAFGKSTVALLTALTAWKGRLGR